jgi:hypothetical protein
VAKIVHIDSIEEGSILGEPVMNNYGQILIPAGATISSKHVMLLKTWNIQTIAIKSDELEETMEMSEEIHQICIERLQNRMKWEARNDNEKDLFQLGVICEYKSMNKKEITEQK